MEWLVKVLETINTLSPLAVIALLGLVLLLQAKNRREVETLSNNHLSGLPEMAETLQRVERTLAALDSFLRAKINGK